MRDLVARTRESVAFHVREGDARVCLYRINTDQPVAHQVRVGEAVPLPDGAPGRVLAAFAGWPGEPYETIRRTGAWLSVGERDPDLASLAAPVFGPGRHLVGVLSVGGPRRRLDAIADEAIGWLTAAAERCTRALGGQSTAGRLGPPRPAPGDAVAPQPPDVR
jgi:DNA-binding IclR family transcriptional regulator